MYEQQRQSKEDKKPFNPEKARRIGVSGEVENIPFDETQTQASIINSINNLGELFKGADNADYDAVFKGVPRPILERYKAVVTSLKENLDRISDQQT